MKGSGSSDSIIKEQVLREIEDLTSNAQQQFKTPLMRFIRCPQLQRASTLLDHALRTAQYGDERPGLAAPPSFIPPLH